MKSALPLRLIAVLSAVVFSANVASAQDVDYKPRISGLVKARYEAALNSGDMRFSVRNARLGISGFATSNMTYMFQLELNGNGDLSLLDSYITYNIGNFDLSLGQQSYGFTTELNRGAGNNYFANRSLMGKFASRYYYEDGAGNMKVGDLGPRDLGAMLKYSGKWDVPVNFYFGAFNGSGMGKPTWNGGLNLVGRIEAGRKQGFGGAASYSGGRSPQGQPMTMWGCELRYANRHVTVESEFAKRYLAVGGRDDVMTTAVVHAMYSFILPQNPYARRITPLVRWDLAENVKFVNTLDSQLDSFDAQRITCGVSIGLTDKVLQTEIRFNYEHYFLSRRPSDFMTNQLLQDKFTIEFFARF